MSEEKNNETILRVEGVYKSFGPTKALVDVSLDLRRGEVLGLIGENGSGKSTLSTIIAGIQKADQGSMFLEGEPYVPTDITDAISKGVSMVVQEQGTLNNITVASNIFAGKESEFTKHGLLDIRKMNKAAGELLTSIGVEGINPAQFVNGMSFEERKLLEVARAEYTNPKVLLIDETTTALGQEGRDVMYRLINKMRDSGRSVIFISHDIEELMAICDSITVLRDGHLIGTLSREEMNIHTMRQMMVGREIAENFYRTDYDGKTDGDVALKGEHITYGPLHDVGIEIRKGEILGLGGLTDCGMHDLGKILFGIITPDYGTVTLADGTKIKDTKQAVTHRMGYISKNRDTEALMSAGSITDNLCLASLPQMQKFGFVAPKKEKEMVAKWRDTLSIKMQNEKQFIMYLSGGNKQKVSIAKWLASDADIYIFDCPTRGIDIGVKSEIYKLLTDLKKQGKAILMISEELPELIGMSDRILIFKDGVIKGTFMRSAELTEHKLIDYMI